MNWERFDRLVAHIEEVEPEKFNMKNWVKDRRGVTAWFASRLPDFLTPKRKEIPCGTTLCLAGHASYLAMLDGLNPYMREKIGEFAIRWLDADLHEEFLLRRVFLWTKHTVFLPWSTPSFFVGKYPTKGNVVRTLKRLKKKHSS